MDTLLTLPVRSNQTRARKKKRKKKKSSLKTTSRLLGERKYLVEKSESHEWERKEMAATGRIKIDLKFCPSLQLFSSLWDD